MASENVKIIIQEDDRTQPLGAGTSSDIAFVPGFSSKSDAVKNVPVLCNTVAEFKKQFGEAPRILTDTDVADYVAYGYRAGDYDRSYIYASELLHSGMSVIYANIDSRTPTQLDPLDDIDDVKLLNGTESKYEGLTVTKDSISVTNNTIKDPFTIVYQVTAVIEPATTLEGQLTNIPKKTYIEYVADLVLDDSIRDTLSITDFTAHVNVASDAYKALLNDKDVTSINTIDTIVAFENAGATRYELPVMCTVTLQPNNFGLEVGSVSAELKLSTHTESIIRSFYASMSNVLEQLEDRNEYSVKYITSGGYPAAVKGTVTTIVNNVETEVEGASDKLGSSLIELAWTRGDAVALVDYMMSTEDLYSVGASKESSSAGDYLSVYAKMHKCYESLDHERASFGAAMYPWGIYNCASTLADVDIDNMQVIMPGSFGYMMCVASAIKTSPNWLAMAGVTRGVVPNLVSLYTGKTLTNVIAEEYQPKFGATDHMLSINAITNIRPYGLTLWGNRTLLPVDPRGTKALNFLNTRNMVSDIKKVLYSTAKSLMFEQDSDTLWLRFKSGITPLLNQLVSGNGLEEYRIIRTTTKYNGDPLTRGEMAATVRIIPKYAIEYFELTVQISDQDVTVE